MTGRKSDCTLLIHGSTVAVHRHCMMALICFLPLLALVCSPSMSALPSARMCASHSWSSRRPSGLPWPVHRTSPALAPVARLACSQATFSPPCPSTPMVWPDPVPGSLTGAPFPSAPAPAPWAPAGAAPAAPLSPPGSTAPCLAVSPWACPLAAPWAGVGLQAGVAGVAGAASLVSVRPLPMLFSMCCAK